MVVTNNNATNLSYELYPCVKAQHRYIRSSYVGYWQWYTPSLEFALTFVAQILLVWITTSSSTFDNAAIGHCSIYNI